MRLTNEMRDSFIRRVMDDVPQVDYDEEMRKQVTTEMISLLPLPLRKMWLDKDQSQWLNTCYFYPKTGGSVTIPCPREYAEREAFKKKIGEMPSVKALEEKITAQTKTRSDLKSRLRAVAYGVTTTKALADALPEFVKYMPADAPEAVRSLPVVTGVVDEFIKAGWPKKEVRVIK